MSFRNRPIMAQHRLAIKNRQSQNSSPLAASTNLTTCRVNLKFHTLSKRGLAHAARVTGPAAFALVFAGAAHAQGTMDFSGAQTLMGTFNSRFAYVSVSRASHDAQLYTNSAASLVSSLGHVVTKSSAMQLARDIGPGFAL
jgi:hypothetical protein